MSKHSIEDIDDYKEFGEDDIEDVEEDIVLFEEEKDEGKVEKEFVCTFATNPHKGPCVGDVLERKDLGGKILCNRHYSYLKKKESRKRAIK